ncbi:MAG: DUF3570 domain-containing protein [Bacteroidota bacterium]
MRKLALPSLKWTLCCLLHAGGFILMAQNDSSKTQLPIDANFLFNYYDQDGVHSPVTGGQGTESLQDRSSILQVNIPIDSIARVKLNAGFNYYTSASTDRIDTRMSSASRGDGRARMYVTYEKDRKDGRTTYGGTAGGSIESDYISSSVGVHFSHRSKDNNQEVGLTANMYHDTWVVIFPEELRRNQMAQVPTDRRRTYSLELTYSRVINQRFQALVAAEMVYQNGLLSTPFHRVFFLDESLPRIERLPGERWKFPIALRLHYFAGNSVILRGSYRWYYDTFGLQAHSLRLETPIKITSFLSAYPFYRFHTQTQAHFFKPFGEHLPGATFYTSDFDLSGLNSHNFGVGIGYEPLYGIFRMRWGSGQRALVINRMNVRYIRYLRSDGLESHAIGADIGLRLR